MPVEVLAKRNPRTVLVTGGAGFIGSHLCEALLAQDCTVYCLDNLQTGTEENLASLAGESRFRFIEQDVCALVHPKLRVDGIYNLACAASPPAYQADPVHTMMTCTVGTKNLLDHAAAFAAKFVQASTSEVYGDPEQHPQPESYRGNVSTTGPRACYDEGKRAAEALCYDFTRTGHVDVRVARIFNTYGPRMRPDDGRIVSNFAVQALAGEPITIYGSGEQTRSFCYVSDLVRGLLRLMDVDPAPPGPINLGNPEEYTVSHFAKLIIQLTGTNQPFVHRPLPQDDPQRRKPDISLAQRLLGWKPKVPLAKGLPPTLDWFAQCVGRDAPGDEKMRARA